MSRHLRTIVAATAFAAALFVPKTQPAALACSLVVYQGDSTLYVVGRSLDWKTPIPTNLYVYPAGIDKVSDNKPDAIRWRSRYGAVYAVGYDGGVTEGMNEKGLLVSGLFCKGTVYVGKGAPQKKPMSLAVFVPWMIDNHSTTAEVVKALRETKFTISGATFDGGTASVLHWFIVDRDGNAAVLEFDNGEMRIYEGRDIRVLTNDPQWPRMQAIEKYWQGVGGGNMLPGTVKSPDRYVRATYFRSHVGKSSDPETAVAICRSLLANVSVPYLYEVETEPNVSSTQWRSYANLRDGRYYFDLATNLGIFYVDLSKCDLRPGSKVMKLDTSRTYELCGDASKALRPSAPFTPLY